MEFNKDNDGLDGPPQMRPRSRNRGRTRKCNVVPKTEQVDQVERLAKQRKRTPGSVLFQLEDRFNDEGYGQILEVVMDLKNGPIADEVSKIREFESSRKRANKKGYDPHIIIWHANDAIEKMKEAKPEIFQGHGHDEDFIEELVALTLLHEFDSPQAIRVFVSRKLNGYVQEYCKGYILNPDLEGLDKAEVEHVKREREFLFNKIKSKEELKKYISDRFHEAQDWIKLYEFFIGECSISKNSLGKDRVKGIMKNAIENESNKLIEEVWQTIQAHEETPERISGGISGRVKKVALVAGVIVTAAGIGYVGHKKLSSSDDTDNNLAPTAKNTSTQNPEPVVMSSPTMKMVSGSMQVKPMSSQVVSGVMKVRNLDNQPQSKPTNVVSGNMKVRNLDDPRKPKTPTKEVQKIPEKKHGVGLVKIDLKSLDKLPESNYKKMYEGAEFSVEEVRGRSITGVIEKYLMEQAHGKKERRAYQKNLKQLEKGWLIYMRQLELKVRGKLEKGESVDERDMAEYEYWKMYKVEYRKNYEKAKHYEKKYRKLAKGKKTKNFKRYQGYLDMGTSLMEGLRELNPEIASVNAIPTLSKIRIADENGNVLEYLRDVSNKMGLQVPDKAVIVVAEASKPKVQTKAPEICKVEKKKTEKQPMVSGAIENNVQLRHADLNSYHAVSSLEDVMFGAQSIQPANDNDGLFPWEREDVVVKSNQQEEICIDAGDWLDKDSNETSLYAQTGAFTVDKDVQSEEDLYDEFTLQEQVEIDAADWAEPEKKYVDSGAFTVKSNPVDEEELYSEYNVQEQIEIDATNWANDNDDTEMLASTGAFNQTAKADSVPEEDLYTEYKVEEKPKKKKGFFGRAFGKVKSLFKKAA